MSKKEPEIKLVEIGSIKPTKKGVRAVDVNSGDINFDRFVQEALASVKSKDK